MSDSIIISAIIGILAALIGGFGAIIARPQGSGGSPTIYIVAFVATIFAAIGFIGGLLFTRNSSDSSLTQIPMQAPTVVTSATNTPTKSTAQGCLPKSEFVAIMNKWHDSDSNNPSPAIEELDQLFNQETIGEAWNEGPYTISQGFSGSVVYWTNTLGKPINKLTSSGVTLDLFLTGGYGIRGAWDTDVEVPTPGRSAWICERLDPERDFPWWG